MMTRDIQETNTLTIDHIGGRGDGVSRDDERAVHVPYTLPGEVVEVVQSGDKARLVSIVTPSPLRITPICQHFGVCGGCSLQHWDEAAILAWKGDLVARALARKGIDVEVGPAIAAWGIGRRRASFHGKMGPKGFEFGFAQAKSHKIEQLNECPVLTATLQSAMPRLRALAEGLAPKSETIDLVVTETPTGLDVDVRNAGKVGRFERRGLERLGHLADAAGVGRLTLHGHTAVSRASPRVKMGDAIVAIPAGAFLQATRAGEEALVAKVLEWTAGRKHVADLFSGIGTFALRLKETAQVTAIESDPAAVAAMKQAADGRAGGKTLTAIARDLYRAPFTPHEMKGIDAIVFDPPRAGAEAQALQIARSKVGLAIAISCDPTTFARDAAILIEGGFVLREIMAFDQFRFTSHVEIAAKFVRPKK
jgi:23S rRNA (uracil1939-C5)-methyltransferase